METDLNLNSSKYSISLVVFFIGYVICGVPSKFVLASPPVVTRQDKKRNKRLTARIK